jgi:hypothetical protein
VNAPNPETVKRLVDAASQAAPIATHATGWSWTSYGVWALVGLLTPIMVAFMRMWPAMRKLRNESDGSLRSDLMKLLAAERRDCSRRIGGLQNKMDAMTRQFVSFQIVVARALPNEAAPHAQAAADRLMDIVMRPTEQFEPSEEQLDQEAQEHGDA